MTLARLLGLGEEAWLTGSGKLVRTDSTRYNASVTILSQARDHDKHHMLPSVKFEQFAIVVEQPFTCRCKCRAEKGELFNAYYYHCAYY